MSLSNENNRNDYVGNGATSVYSYTFRIFEDSDLVVTKRTTANVESTLTLTTDYTVSGAGDDAGGSITLVAGALTSGYTLTIRRVRPITQETDIKNQGTFYPETHEDAFDHCVMIDQQQQDEIDRSAKLPESVDGDDVDPTLPVPVAGQSIRWNSTADAFEAYSPASAGTIAVPLSNGVAVYTGSNNFIARTITGSSSLTVTNGDGVSGNPTLAIPSGGVTRTLLGTGGVGPLATSTPSTNYTLTSSDDLVLVSASAGAVTLTLPTAVGISGRVYRIKRTDNTPANAVTVDANSTETLDGALTITLSYQHEYLEFVSDNTNWKVVNHFRGNEGVNILSKTANYTLTASDNVILGDATAGAITFTLPAAASNTGRIYKIKRTDSTPANAITIDPNASETIDGDLTRTLSFQYEYVEIFCDGSNWKVINHFQGNPRSNLLSKTSTYTLTTSDGFILCDATSAGFTLNLPAAASNSGRIYTIKRTDNTPANAVTIDGSASETIDGDLTRTLSFQHEAVEIFCDGSNWKVIVHHQGSPRLNQLSKTANYTATTSDSLILCDASGGAFTISLPAAASNTGRVYRFKRTDNTPANAVTIDPNSSETIEADSTRGLYTLNEALEIISDGTNWRVLGHKSQSKTISYTPTCTGFGTISTPNVYWYRSGDRAIIIGKFVAGTVTAVEARVSLPTGLTIDSGKIGATVTQVGNGCRSAVGSGQLVVLAEPSVAYVTFGVQGASSAGQTKALGTDLIGNAETVSFHANVPIVNWNE